MKCCMIYIIYVTMYIDYMLIFMMVSFLLGKIGVPFEHGYANVCHQFYL